MPSIGETLREARLRQGIEIAEVEQATKIRTRYLRALEAEDFDRLPGPTFVRTFLRTYAEYLGLDPHLLVEEYRTQHEPAGDEEVQRLGPPPPAPREGRRRAPAGDGGTRWGTVIAGAVLAVLAILLVIGLIAGGDGGEPERRPETAGGEGAGGRDGRDRGGGGGRQGNRQAVREEVRLRVAPASETYVCVVAAGDSEPLINEVIQEPETFRGRRLLVNLGNTLVELRMNGEEVPVEESPNPAGFEFTPAGHEELPEGERPCT